MTSGENTLETLRDLLGSSTTHYDEYSGARLHRHRRCRNRYSPIHPTLSIYYYESHENVVTLRGPELEVGLLISVLTVRGNPFLSWVNWVVLHVPLRSSLRPLPLPGDPSPDIYFMKTAQ